MTSSSEVWLRGMEGGSEMHGNSSRRQMSASGRVRFRTGFVQLECSLFGENGRMFLELRARSDTLDLWRKLDEEEFQQAGGVSCSLERFAQEIGQLLTLPSSGSSRRLELTDDDGHLALALIHVDGAWETEECVLPMDPTPLAIQLSDVWSSLSHQKAEIVALESANADRAAAVARACPQNSSLIALKESVDFWQKKSQESSGINISLLVNEEVSPVEARIGAIKLQLEGLSRKKHESSRKVKALEELAQGLNAACGALVVQRKELQEAIGSQGNLQSTARKEDKHLDALNDERERFRREAAKTSDLVRAKKRQIQFGYAPDFKSKSKAIVEKDHLIATLKDKLKSREKTSASIAQELLISAQEKKAWVNRRQGLVWLEQWLAAKDGHLTGVLSGQVAQLQDLLEQVEEGIGENSALFGRLKEQLGKSRELVSLVSLR